MELFSYKVAVDLKMFCTLMKNGIGRNMDGTMIVAIKDWRFDGGNM
jgi:hypothetical protein